jgi:hypothetical protein
LKRDTLVKTASSINQNIDREHRNVWGDHPYFDRGLLVTVCNRGIFATCVDTTIQNAPDIAVLSL